MLRKQKMRLRKVNNVHEKEKNNNKIYDLVIYTNRHSAFFFLDNLTLIFSHYIVFVLVKK